MSAEKEVFDPAILATMTDEERAAIEQDDMDPAELARLQAIADSAGGAAEEGGAAADAVAGAAPIDGKDAAGEGVTLDADAAGTDYDEGGRAAPMVRYDAKMPEDLETKLTDIDTRRKEAAAKFKEGEIDFDAYTAENDALMAERATLDRHVTKAEIAEEITTQNAVADWNAAIGRQIAKALKEDGIDYNKDAAKGKDLDNAVKLLASDPANGDKSYDWYLAEGHAMVKAKHRIPDRVAGDAPGKPAPRTPPAAASIPKTLAQVPGGQGPGDVADEFAELDRLSGIEYEVALAKLTPAMREKYVLAA